MKKNNLKNIAFSVMALALIFGIALPAFANEGSEKSKSINFGQAKKESKVEKNESKKIDKSDSKETSDILKIGNTSWNTGYRAAQNTFDKEMKVVRNVYKQDKRLAQNVLSASLKAAKGNQDAITQSYNVYRNSLVVALEKMFNGEQVAFNKFITTLKNLTISPVPVVNHAPVANSQSLKVIENGSVAITLTGSDPDIFTDSVNSGSLKFIIVSNPTHGILSGTGASQKYVPSANFNGSDSFTFKVSDGSLESAIATVSITVVSSNSAPVAFNQTVSTAQNIALALTLSGSDVDGCSAQSFGYSVDGPANGGLSSSSGVASCVDGKINFGITYTPKAGFLGTDSFNFRLSDGTVNSNTANVSVVVK